MKNTVSENIPMRPGTVHQAGLLPRLKTGTEIG